jgi:glycosyltransferase involved in cell wall biosynthesis
VLDVIVHEPFVHFVGPSWIQPVRALTQRSMVRNVVRPARRVWISIPGWESRLSSRWLGMTVKPRVLPVPATIPVDANRDAIAKIRATLVGHGHTSIVGYFGAGGPYAEHALALTAAALYRSGNRMAVLCLGRGSEQVASRLQRDLPAQSGHVLATGTLSLAALSHYLQVCDVLLQPYVDGVSGRRTTTVSALEHGVPIATTFGVLSEPYWRETEAVETAPADTPASLDAAVQRLLDPDRNARARASARRLYSERFDPVVAFAPLFAD